MIAPETAPPSFEITDRQRWMGVLARADETRLEALVAAEVVCPAYSTLRGPETGLVMVQARAGGTGSPFNIGEMTVTRCAVRLPAGTVGHSYVAGRRPAHAERAALLDALLQDAARRDAVLEAVIEPLAREEAEKRTARDAEAAATKVDFFTLVRGED